MVTAVVTFVEWSVGLVEILPHMVMRLGWSAQWSRSRRDQLIYDDSAQDCSIESVGRNLQVEPIPFKALS